MSIYRKKHKVTKAGVMVTFLSGLLITGFLWLFVERLIYISESYVMEGVVTSKTSTSKKTFDYERNRMVDAVSLVISFKYTDSNGGIYYGSELAPAVWPFYSVGSAIKIYSNPNSQTMAVIANPIQFYLYVLFYCFFLFLALPLCLGGMKDENVPSVIKYPVFLLPMIVVGVCLFMVEKGKYEERLIIQKEAEKEKLWPSWPEFETAVPKPFWWGHVGFDGFDPMRATTSESLDLLYSTSPAESERSAQEKKKYTLLHYKIAYASFLRFKDDPYLIHRHMHGGGSSVMLPLTHFFVDTFWDTGWEPSDTHKSCNYGKYYGCSVDSILVNEVMSLIRYYRFRDQNLVNDWLAKILEDRYHVLTPP